MPWPSTAARAWPPASHEWELAAELDLARLPSQTLSGTSERFGAHAWTVGNAANADTLALVQGAGLRIAPKTGTAYVSEPTAPFVELALADLVPDYQAGDRLLVQVWVDAAGLDAGTNRDGRAYGLQVGSGTTWSDTYVGLYALRYEAGLLHRLARVIFTTYQSTDVAAASEPRFLAVEYLAGFAGFAHASTPSWPEPSAMTRPAYGCAIAPITPPAPGTSFAAATDVLRLWAERAGSPTPDAFTATFRALRILRQPWGRP